jgi:hypothetical protein
MLPTHRVATHPGELLRRLFLDEMGITQMAFAKHTGMSLQRLNQLIERFAQAAGRGPRCPGHRDGALRQARHSSQPGSRARLGMRSAFQPVRRGRPPLAGLDVSVKVADASPPRRKDGASPGAWKRSTSES